MHLTPGARIGAYEILAPLGAGGMGEVYRARDSRLGRDVAIKVLPEGFAQDPERLARFEREAKLLASLSHPNIAGIYGLEDVAGARSLVLELVEGETLAERLARGPLPLDETVEVCRQIAAGVEAAHENGVVHRDLKPGNVMLTPSGAVKVLDFGLAKGGAASASSASTPVSASPTMTYAATSAGMILGTAAYMSPEQARGKAVDRRTDVWSFGCVLYECLTGRQAFEGETASDLIARILEREPDWSALPLTTPPRVAELLHRCLTKDSTLRLRDIGEARVLLGATNALAGAGATGAGGAGVTGAGRRTTRRWLAPALAALLAMVATAAVFVVLRPARTAAPVRRFRVPVEGLQTNFNSPLAFSRDGRRLAYEANGRIWIRRMDQLDASEVPGSQGARAAFWSWDQSALGFVNKRKLWKFSLGADQSYPVCDIPESGEIVGGAWGADGGIRLAVWRGGLYEVPAKGGELRPVIPLDSTLVDFHSPSFLPDGRTLLVFVHKKSGANLVATVEGSPPRLRSILDDPTASMVSYAPSGHLLINREDDLYRTATWAVPFSLARRNVTGPAFLVLDGAGSAMATPDGMLAAAEDEAPPPGQLVWMRSDGSGGEAIGEPLPGLMMPALSPDGGRVAYATVEDGNADVWVGDLTRGTRTRLTSSAVWEGSPAWSPDGARIYYGLLSVVGADRILVMDADGGGTADTLASGRTPAVSPDGKSLAYTVDRRGNADVWTVGLIGGHAAAPFLQTESNEAAPAISPDGHWLSYVSDESGRNEVYLRRYPEGDLRTQVSVNGGNWPRWTRRGDAIFYVNRDTLTMVEVRPGPRPALGLPRALVAAQAAELRMNTNAIEGCPLDAHPDGSRFIGVRKIASPTTRALIFVQNWFEEFRGR